MDGVHDRLDRSLAEFLRRLSRRMDVSAMNRLAEADVSLTQVRLLFMLASGGVAVPVGELAGRLAVPVATASRNVDQLVRLGLLERNECLEDRRVKLVSLSAAGVAMTEEYMDSQRQSMRNFVATLPIEACEPLADALEAILVSNSMNSTTEGTQTHGNS